MKRVLVIGSGPGAWACCRKLIQMGIKPTVWDGGEELDSSSQRLKDELKSRTASTLSDEQVQKLYYGAEDNEEFPKKTSFGSDFLYGLNRRHSPTISSQKLVVPTYAKGGLASAWGGALLPIRQEDMQDWPIEAEQLKSHFQDVLSDVPLTGDESAIDVFPSFGHPFHELELSETLAEVRRKTHRPTEGFMCHSARLALHTTGASACTHCGLCLTGCPRDSIFSFANAFSSWERQGAVEYHSGYIAHRIEERNSGVVVSAFAGEGYESRVFDQVFVAAGSLNSARIALESRCDFDAEIEMFDVQKFIIPLFSLKKSKPEEMDQIELCRLFANFKMESGWRHVQLTQAGRYVEENLPGFLPPIAKKWLRQHMIIGWGGLPSKESHSFSLRLLRAHRSGQPILDVELKENQNTAKSIYETVRKFYRHMSPSGLIGHPRLIEIAPAGGGFHIGGTLPMANHQSTPYQSDLLGRLPFWKNVFFVDSSVLPSLPATTSAGNIMANSTRITSEALGLMESN